MSKSVKKRPPFVIPTIEQVVEFMDKNMKDWPREFCQHYGHKFWMSYQAKGWRISGSAMMKDFHAAFWARWAHVPYPEEKKFLEKCMQSVTHRILLDERRRKSAGLFAITEGEGPTKLDRYLESLDEIFNAFKVGNASDIQLRQIGEWLNRNNLPGVTPAQLDRIMAERGNDGEFGRILLARQFFANLLRKEITVSQYYHSKISQQGENAKTA
jgi:hypothetical protein